MNYANINPGWCEGCSPDNCQGCGPAGTYIPKCNRCEDSGVVTSYLPSGPLLELCNCDQVNSLSHDNGDTEGFGL